MTVRAMTLAEGEPVAAHKPRLHSKYGTPLFDWTEKADADLRKMHADGYSFQYIAKTLGCSRNAAIGKAHRMGLVAGQLSAEQIERNARIRAEREANRLRTPRIERTKRKRADNDHSLNMRFASQVDRGLLRIGSYGWPTIVKQQTPPIKRASREPKSLNLTILELTDATCKWAHGDEAPYFFCGQPSEHPVSPYCAFHQHRATRPA